MVILMLSRQLLLLAITILAALALASTAQAAAPTLLSVGHQDRHVTGAFSAPGADDASVSIASSPDRATDGSFLSENYAGGDSLTAGEIASGVWLDEDQLDPGVYYVMLRTFDWDQAACDPVGCYGGYSNVMTLTVPEPRHRFKATIERDYISSFTLSVSKLGETLPYRLCWNKAKGRRKCLRGKINGYDWNDTASDTLYLTVADLKLGKRQRFITFKWYADGKRVTSKRLRLRRR